MDFVRSLGYIPVLNPSVDILPLSLLIKNKDDVECLNAELSDLFISDEQALPLIKENIHFASIISNNSTLKIGANINFTFIKKAFFWLSNDMNAGLDLNDNKNVSIKINKALKDTLNIFSLASYIRSSSIVDIPTNLYNKIMNGEIFVVTEIIKSNDFSIIVEKSNYNKVSGEIDINVVNSNLDLSIDNNKLSETKYVGDEFLTLGVKAYKIFSEEGFSSSGEHGFRIENQKNLKTLKEDDFQGQLLVANKI